MTTERLIFTLARDATAKTAAQLLGAAPPLARLRGKDDGTIDVLAVNYKATDDESAEP